MIPRETLHGPNTVFMRRRRTIFFEILIMKLNPEQIDEVDVGMILAKIGASARPGEEKTVALPAWRQPTPATD